MLRCSLRYWIWVFLALCFLTSSVLAQVVPNPNTDMGISPFASLHGGDFDSVSLFGGNLSLHIPLVCYPQRGGKLSLCFFIRYNNKGFIGFPWPVCSQGSCVTTYKWLWRGNGVEVVRDGTLGVQDNSQSVPVQNCPGGPSFCNPVNVQMFSAVSPDGASHPMGGLCSADSSGPGCESGANFWDATAIDASGIHYFDQQCSPSQVSPNLVDPSGIRHYQQNRNQFAVQNTCPPIPATPGYWAYDLQNGTPIERWDTSYVSSSVDPNGNAISVTSSGWVDTLGRLIPGSAPTTGDYGATNKYEMILPGVPTLDFSNCPATAASARIWNAPGPSSGTSTFKLCYSDVPIATNFHTPYTCNTPGGGTCYYTEWNFTVRLMTGVVLPDLSSWRFDYNNYGDLAKITFPTGASISYTWTNYAWPTADINTPTSRTVSTRSVDANDGNGPQTWTYQWCMPGCNFVGTNGFYMQVTVTDPQQNDTVHKFTPVIGYQELHETKTQFYQGSYSAGTLLKTVDTQYSGSSNPYDIYNFPVRVSDTVTSTNVVPTTVTTTWSNGEKSQSTYSYDAGTSYVAYDNRQGTYGAWNTYTAIYGSKTQANDYDLGNGSVGPLLRSTKTNFEWQASNSYLSANLLSLPSSVTVSNGSGCKMAETDYTYDESSYLTVYGGTLPQGTHGSPPNSVRGNPTTVKQQLFGGSVCPTTAQSGPTSHTNWYDTGEPYQITDPLGNITTHTYDSAYAGAYSTKTCNPLNQCVSGTYDFNTGLLTSFTDVNASYQASGTTTGDPAHTSFYQYNDSLWRMTQVQLPADPSGNQPQTTFKYPNLTTKETLKSTTASLTDDSFVYTDGLGRTNQTVHTSAGGATVVTTYDPLGRVASVTNPYFSTSDTTYGVTSFQYDALGRVTQTTKQDGGIVSGKYDQTAAASGNGTCTLSTDEAGHQRTTCADGIGRLIEVDEPATSSSGTNAVGSITISGELNNMETTGGSPLIAGTGSPLTSYVASDGTSHTFYLGSNQHVYQLLWTSATGWQDQDLTSITDNTTAVGNSSLTSIYDPSGISHLIYEDSNQHVRELMCCNTGWQNQDLTMISGATAGAASGSALTGFADSSGNHVYDLAVSQHEFEFFGDGWSWLTQDLTGSSGTSVLPISGTKLTSFSLADGTEHSVYLGTNQHIYQLVFTPDTGYVNQDLTVMAALDVTDGQCAAENGTCYVNGTQTVAFGINGTYNVQTATGSISCNDATFGDPAVGSVKVCYRVNSFTSPASGTSLASLVDSNGQHIYFLGTDGHQYQLWFDGLNWHTQDQTSFSGASVAVASGSALTTFAMSDATEHAAYVGTNQHVYQIVYSPTAGTWTNQDLTSLAGTTTLAAAGSALTSFGPSDGNLAHIQYLDANAHLNHLYYTGSGIWQNEDVVVTVNSTVADSGTVSLTVGTFTVSACFGGSTSQGCSGQTNDLATDVAASLAQALNNPSSPVTASVSGSDINMTWKIGGASSATVSALSTTHDNPSQFPSPSFTSYATSFAGGTGSSSGTPAVTLYTYDALGNLTCAVQKGTDTTAFTGCTSAPSIWRPRSFSYDSLSRLLTATNPESGTIVYGYDLNGNLLQKTSAAPNEPPGGTATQTISYCYDPLNRVTGRAYSAQNCQNGRLPVGTDIVAYFYDSGTNGKGHLTSLIDEPGSASYTYDALGRVTAEQRTIAGISKSMAYGYNLDNSLATVTYPSGAIVTYTPDAAGRVVSVTDAGNGINYVTNATYGADNSVAGFLSGNTITSSFSYNKRLQPVNMSASASSQTVFSIGYDFHLASGDNGNVYGITNYRDQTRNQTFTYDALNRLASAENAGTDCTIRLSDGNLKFWGNSYSYDTWGNLINKTPLQGSCAGESLSVTALPNNQLAGYGYDAAGNMIHDLTIGNWYTYDAENRIIGTGGYNYIYDVEGNRVEKSNGSTGMLYWYMSPGIIGESDLLGNIQHEYVFFNGERVARKDGSVVSYYFSDHLKTADVITDANGNIQAESDYYPWGGELKLINNDSNHYKFTGKERDLETGLDYFGARYYANALARFIQPDPKALSKARLVDPQQWNRYSYVRNNPLIYVDADGKELNLWLVVKDQSARAEVDKSAPKIASDFHRWGVKEVHVHITSHPSLVRGSHNTVTVNFTNEAWMTKSAIFGDHHTLSTNVTVNTGLSNFASSIRNVTDHEVTHEAQPLWRSNGVSSLFNLDHSSDPKDIMFAKYDVMGGSGKAPQMSPEEQKMLQDEWNDQNDKDETTVTNEDQSVRGRRLERRKRNPRGRSLLW